MSTKPAQDDYDPVGPAPLPLPAARPIILGVKELRPPEHPGNTYWLWQVDVDTWYSPYLPREIRPEYLLTFAGFEEMAMGHYKPFETRADAMRSLGMLATD